jgi:hypothetical protein
VSISVYSEKLEKKIDAARSAPPITPDGRIREVWELLLSFVSNDTETPSAEDGP